MEAVEGTAERIAEYIKSHPQNVQVAGRKEISHRNLLSVEGVLKTMPGAEVHRSSGIGSRISIRGSGKSDGVLVLLSGRPLNTNWYGGVGLNVIPVEMVESVTVFEPPVPVWLGTGATDGASNIATRDLATGRSAKKDRHTTITTSAGSSGLYEGSVGHVVPIIGGNIMFAGAGSHRKGKRTNSDKGARESGS